MGCIVALRSLTYAVIAALCLLPSVIYAQADDNSRFQTKMHDTTGQYYDVNIFSEDEKLEVVKASWAGAKEGDIVYSGHYQFTVKLSDIKQGVQSSRVSPLSERVLSFNASRSMFYVCESVHMDTPDVLFVMQAGNSNNTPVMAYCIKDGVMQPLIWRFSDTKLVTALDVVNGYRIISATPGCYQTKVYSMGKGGFFHRDWQVDIDTNVLNLVNTEFLSYDEEMASRHYK